MNKNNISKLKLILMGIENRYIENIKVFKNITISYALGAKKIVASATLNDENNKLLEYHFDKCKKLISISDLLDDITNQCQSYDEASIIYCERGETIYIYADNKNVTMTNKKNDETIKIKKNSSSNVKCLNNSISLSSEKCYLKVGECNNLLRELNLIDNDLNLKNDKVKKYIELNEYIYILQDILNDIPNNKIVNILDCNCNNSHLLFALNYYITEVKRRKCNFIGLASCTSNIDSYKLIASNLGYRNMEFYDTDISSFKSKKEINILISINNINTSLDASIALGVKSNVDTIIYLSNPLLENYSKIKYEPLQPILTHKVINRKFNEVVNDGMRSLILESKGYSVKINEYTSINQNFNYLVTKAFKTNEENFDILNEYMNLMGTLNIYPELYALLNEWD